MTVKKDYGSLVRNNLMSDKSYTPYCGGDFCTAGVPRTVFKGDQFHCRCGWRSGYEPEFIKEYKLKWGK